MLDQDLFFHKCRARFSNIKRHNNRYERDAHIVKYYTVLRFSLVENLFYEYILRATYINSIIN